MLGGGRGSPLVRIGIGARPAQEARRIADLLAAAARTRFDEIGRRAVSGSEAEKPGTQAAPGTGVEPIFSGETPEEVAAEMRGYLKVVKLIVEQEPRQPSAEQAQAFEGLTMTSYSTSAPVLVAFDGHRHDVLDALKLTEQPGLAPEKWRVFSET